MKIPPSWQTAACGAGLFLTASAACFCAAEQLWLTAAVCVAAFVGLYASLHHRQTPKSGCCALSYGASATAG